MVGDVTLGLALTVLAWLTLLVVVLHGRRVVERFASRPRRSAPVPGVTPSDPSEPGTATEGDE
jgi:hypothetical protein